MWELKSRDLYQKIFFYKNLFFSFINILVVINFFVSFVIFNDKNIYFWNLVIILFALLTQFMINISISLYVDRVLRKKMIIELLRMDTKTKKDEKSKVTCVFIVNDYLNEARIIQSMRQKYKLIDFWVIDNFNNPKVKDFCKSKEINYFKLPKQLDNTEEIIKSFLLSCNVSFDYLMVTNSNIIVDKNFVSSSLQMFSYQEKNRIGFISSQMQNIKENNLYKNIFLNYENVKLFSEVQLNNFKIHDFYDLRNDSVFLIKKEWIDECLLSTFSHNKVNWENLINPFVVSLKPFNDSYLKFLQKEKNFKNKKIVKGFEIPSNIFGIWNCFLWTFFISTILTILIISWNQIINSQWFSIFVISFVVVMFLYLFLYLIKTVPIIRWKTISLIFFNLFHFVSKIWLVVFRFNSIKKYIALLIGLSLILIGINIIFLFDLSYLNINLSNFGWIYLLISINVLFGSMWISIFSFIFLYTTSLIKIKRNKTDGFVFYENKYVSNEKIIKKYKNNLFRLKRI